MVVETGSQKHVQGYHNLPIDPDLILSELLYYLSWLLLHLVDHIGVKSADLFPLFCTIFLLLHGTLSVHFPVTMIDIF